MLCLKYVNLFSFIRIPQFVDDLLIVSTQYNLLINLFKRLTPSSHPKLIGGDHKCKTNIKTHLYFILTFAVF